MNAITRSTIPPNSSSTEQDRFFLDLAIDEARAGWAEGGVPIGAVLVHEGRVLSTGRNRRAQLDSPIRHAEIDCLENAGRLPAAVYRDSVMYTTLSPCFMCAGAALLYRIPRFVIGENRNWDGAEDLLRSHGVEITVLDDRDCLELLDRMRTERPQLWAEDSGVGA